MKTRIFILLACISLVAAATLAHGGEEHVIGTVAKVAPDSIAVKTAANKMVTVAVAPETKFMKAKAAAKIADLNVGDRVVIHAKEVTEGHLVADTVEFAAATPAQQSKAQTLTGVVSDAMCGATHNMKNMTPAECTRACAKSGGYALVVGKDVYALKGHEAELDKLAAETVTVRGTLSGKTLSVESVAPAKRG
jgi:hypothetical protein